MTLLALAPLAESFDFFLFLALCYLPPFIFFYFGWKASKSGSLVKRQVEGAAPGVTEWVESKENIPFIKTGQFKFGIYWILLATFFFFVFLWPDHRDVWFINK
jgi:hypothetical protein